MYFSLYDYYKSLEQRKDTFEKIFEQTVEYKEACLNRTGETIYADRNRFSMLSKELKEKPISEINEEDIQRWVAQSYLPTRPSVTYLRKQFQLLNQVFEYGIRKKYCTDNPMRYLSVRDYVNGCKMPQKRNEDREFSEQELELLYNTAMEKQDNPRALMMLMSMENVMHGGELAALLKSDISNGLIHVHRQQRKTKSKGEVEKFHDVMFNKDERQNPHDGRYIPMTRRCAEAVELVLKLAGESDHLFHDSNGEPVKKSAYYRYLKRQCNRLSTNATNNHAFRIAFNSRLIENGFS